MQGINQPVVLIGATTWWQLSARMAMAFLRHGCSVSALCPSGHPLRFVVGLDNCFLYRGINSLQSLEDAILAVNPDLIVPCDDGVVWQLHALHAKSPALRKLIESSLGPSAMYQTICSRADLLSAADELGIRIPLTKELYSKSDLDTWKMPSGVLKIDGSWGGSGVEIAGSRREMVEAYAKLTRPKGASFYLKRFVVNRDPLAVWSWRYGSQPRATIQQYIHGRPANTMFACWRGEVIGIITVEVLNSQGATGAATVVQIIENPEITEAANKIARRLSLHGFHGLDFILENETNHAYLIELNPRCTQLGHLRRRHQEDLAGIFVQKLRNQKSLPSGIAIASDTVALFPQAFLMNPNNPYLELGHHDVPWEQPALLHELLRGPWPERQLPARIYHFLRPPKQPIDLPVKGIEETQP